MESRQVSRVLFYGFHTGAQRCTDSEPVVFTKLTFLAGVWVGVLSINFISSSVSPPHMSPSQRLYILPFLQLPSKYFLLLPSSYLPLLWVTLRRCQLEYMTSNGGMTDELQRI
jgi:hypothetical protein